MANSTTDERKFALSVLYGTTFYRTLLRSFAGRDSLSLILCRADWAVWVLIPASRGIAITLHHRSMTSMQQTQYRGGVNPTVALQKSITLNSPQL